MNSVHILVDYQLFSRYNTNKNHNRFLRQQTFCYNDSKLTAQFLGDSIIFDYEMSEDICYPTLSSWEFKEIGLT